MEDVDLMLAQNINVFLDRVDGLEVTRAVEHHAAPREAGSIFDLGGDGGPFDVGAGLRIVNRCREKLEE